MLLPPFSVLVAGGLTGRPAIKKLFIALTAIAAIACGAIYMILSPQPTIKRTSSEPPSRLLPYEQQIARTPDPAAAPEESAPPAHETAPAGTAAPQPGAQDPAAADQSAETTGLGGSTGEDPDSSDMTALPADEGADPSDPSSQLPWQNAGRPDPAIPGEGADAPDSMAALPGEGADPSDPMAAPPADGAEPYDPNAELPGEPGRGYEEWVQVLVSGAAMQSGAAEDAPMLFAFPYGRNLRVVSRYEGWVEVTDPQSSATGWMKAQYLAPVAAPGAPQQTESYYDEEPRERRGWFRRRPGGLADMINKALGGN